MLAIMLAAVMLDRRALTLRNVALAAFVVIAMAPESRAFGELPDVLRGDGGAGRRLRGDISPGGPSAAACRHNRLRPPPAPLDRRVSPGAHFARRRSRDRALCRLPLPARSRRSRSLANLAAMPAVGILVMPMALFAVILMPFGLESLPLAIMDWGLDWMMLVARRSPNGRTGSAASQAPHRSRRSSSSSPASSGSPSGASAGGLPGIVPIARRCCRSRSRHRRPTFSIAEERRTFAVRGADRPPSALPAARARASRSRTGCAPTPIRATPTRADLADGVGCDPWGCVATLGDGNQVALVLAARRLRRRLHRSRRSSSAASGAARLRRRRRSSSIAIGCCAMAPMRSGASRPMRSATTRTPSSSDRNGLSGRPPAVHAAAAAWRVSSGG